MTIVEHVFKDADVPESARAFARDTVTLGWEDRTHVHGRRRTDGGVEFGTSLPRGSVLRDGDFFVLEDERLVVAIVERAEPVFVVEPRSAQEWGLFAYHIGNCHQPLMLTGEAIVCADLPGMEETLDYHRIPFTRRIQPFTPIADGAAQTHQP